MLKAKDRSQIQIFSGVLNLTIVFDTASLDKPVG